MISLAPTSAARGRAPTRLVPPDVVRRLAPSVILGLTLFVGLLATGASLLVDPDTQWHIEVGRRIWSAHAVPSTDIFSHTFQGAPWIAKEWLSQLAFYAAHRAGGWTGVVCLAAGAVAVSFALLQAVLGRTLRPATALALTLAALVLALPHVLARPHILVLPIVVAWTATLVARLDAERAPPLPLALLMMAWANMHGSFPLGLILAGLLAGEGVFRAPGGLVRPRAVQWATFLAAALAATLVSPQGWRALLVSLRMSGNGATLAYVDEWHPLRLDLTGCLALAMLGVLTLALLRQPRANLFRLLAVAFLAYLMLRHARFISLFGILAPVIAARALGRWTGGPTAAEDTPSRFAGPLPAISIVGMSIVGMSIVALAVTATMLLATIAPRPAPDITPEAAYRAALAAGATGPVYNDYDFGGFLIAHGVETFVDGRTDQLFLGPFLPALASAITTTNDAPFAGLLRHYGVTWALVRAGSGEARHLDHMAGWTRVHVDPVAAAYLLK